MEGRGLTSAGPEGQGHEIPSGHFVPPVALCLVRVTASPRSWGAALGPVRQRPRSHSDSQRLFPSKGSALALRTQEALS